jgi:hypothetical protein
MYQDIARQGAVLVQPIGLGVRMLPQLMEKHSVFSFIMSALHASRQLRAIRVLRQYEHLVAPALAPHTHAATMTEVRNDCCQQVVSGRIDGSASGRK